MIVGGGAGRVPVAASSRAVATGYCSRSAGRSGAGVEDAEEVPEPVAVAVAARGEGGEHRGADGRGTGLVDGVPADVGGEQRADQGFLVGVVEGAADLVE